MILRPLMCLALVLGPSLAFAADTKKEAAKTPAAAPAVTADEYVLDTDHSSIGFEIPHLVISSVEGRFKKFSGSFFLDEKALKAKSPDALKIKATIDVASIDTAIEKRDTHLKSPDFFDAAKYPTITFESRSLEYKGDKLLIKGDLTIRDKTRAIVLETVYKGSVSAYDKKRAAFKASSSFNRKDFGLNWNDVVEAGPVVGDTVSVTLVIQGIRKADM